MSAFGAMFPGQKIRDESSEAGNAQQFLEFGPIDLENGTVTLRGLGETGHPAPADDEPAEPVDPRRGPGPARST